MTKRERDTLCKLLMKAKAEGSISIREQWDGSCFWVADAIPTDNPCGVEVKLIKWN